MIEYVEIRDENRELIGIVDTAKSIIWHSICFGVGDFEIYAPVTPEHVDLLREGRYVTRVENEEVGIIEHVGVADNLQDGEMIVASGRFAKSILDRRIIYTLSGNSNSATVLSGNVEDNARKLVSDNAIACAFDESRNMPELVLGPFSGSSEIIVDESGAAAQKQVINENLLTYTDALLAENSLAAIVKLDEETLKLQYSVFRGKDRSANNTEGNDPVVFSREFDNLTASDYTYDTKAFKNVALIGGEGDGTERVYSMLAGDQKGLQRREMFIDASGISKKYKVGEVEKTHTDSEYHAVLEAHGRQTLAPLATVEHFAGAIDVTNGSYVLGRDFALGDIVTVQDNRIGKYIDVRICETIEVQDDNGYTVEAVYQ